jgi:hypothetical protein
MSHALFSGRRFQSAEAAACQYQYEASLRSESSRNLARFGLMRCSLMQREAAELYAAARAAITKATGSAS